MKSCARKLVDFRATLTASRCDMVQGNRLLSTTSSGVKESAAVKPVVKTSKGISKSSHSKNRKSSTPFIEHQEDKRTSFSRTNFVTLQERLSDDEMNILSQLARAHSLPDDVRCSLRAYLDRQNALVDDEHISSVVFGPKYVSPAETLPAVKSKKRKKVLKKQSLSSESVTATSSKPLWSVEDLKDTEQLKVLLERTAKLLSSNKRLLLERAVEHDRQMKENAYHDRMASFVELCINTGMVCTYIQDE